LDEVGTMTEMTYAMALNAAIRQEMRRDESVLMLGEDIALGGMYTVSKGLRDEFGPDRIIDTPIAEEGFVGIAVGAAAGGLRPLAEVMFVDFSFLAADQILNQAAKLRFLSGGEVAIPITIRTQQGISGGGGAQHSQSLEAMFAHVPGLAIALPFTPADAKGLLAAAIRMNEPAIVMEHKRLYFMKGEVPDGEHVVQFGKGVVRRPGSDVTIIAYSRMVEVALAASEQLEQIGLSAEVIDLRTIVPLDLALLVESVTRTHAAVVVQEASPTASVASHIAALVTERCWGALRSPVARVTGLDIPVPYAKSLEDRWLVSPEDVVRAATGTVGHRQHAKSGL
jgi:pyruvate/2-oxoglutarate/acetoin dehydrogenase E1 component